MKTRLKQQRVVLTIVILALGLTALPLTEAGAQDSFLLVCRGGGHLTFTYVPFSWVGDEAQLWVYFARGLGAVGRTWTETDLDPGQCSWTDRRIADNEPEHLILTYPDFQDIDFAITWTEGQVADYNLRPDFLVALQSPDEFQSFWVYNDGDDNFLVTAIGEGTYEPVF